MVRDFARLQLFCECQLTFTPRDPFFPFFRTIEINCLTARKGGDISERNNLGVDIIAWFSEHVLCFFFLPLYAVRWAFGRNACFLLDSHRLCLWYRLLSLSHVTALTAILRMATSRKRILRPKLRVQAILILNILRAWEPYTRRTSVNKMIFSSQANHALHAYI